MSKKEFNPSDWVEKPSGPTREPKEVNTLQTDTEKLIEEIEAHQVDITASYENWLKIGFAIADEFQESGRDYFHRISKFHDRYSVSECNTQYNQCLSAGKQGITIKTLFHLAKQEGIVINRFNNPGTFNGNLNKEHVLDKGEEKDKKSIPTFPDSIFNNLPEFLKKVVKMAATNEERDILLLGSLVAVSACLPNIKGVYDGKPVYPNLYIFITAQASAGKGRLIHCKQLVKPIHKYFREQSKALKQRHELEMMEYLEKKSTDATLEKPGKPPEKMLFIPANNSSTGMFQLLNDNEGKGFIFETEGDTLAQAFKSDYGNYSDGFRKAFHHETISFYRRTDREYVDIEKPCISALLSGTPKQISSLIPNAENGLFSRFIFYFMNVSSEWKNVFAIASDNGLEDYFDNLGNEFFTLYKSLETNQEIKFILTDQQQDQFNDLFQQLQTTYLSLNGLEYMATVRRLGLIAFRISMILSALRIMETGDLPLRIVCEEADFNIAIGMIKILVIHAAKVFSELPEDHKISKRKNQKEKFLDILPINFSRKEYLEFAASMYIPSKTAEGYITDFFKKGLIHREKQDCYMKAIEETQDVKEVKDIHP